MDRVIVWIDIETTHLDANLAWPTQIAAVATDRATLKVLDGLEVKVKFTPEYADPDALKRFRYDPKVWGMEQLLPITAAVTLASFLKAYATWTRTSKYGGNTNTWTEIGGHNAATYDSLILKRWFDQLQIKTKAALWHGAVVDTMQLARQLEFACDEHWEGGFSLGALCERFGIEHDLAREHDALYDVSQTVELARRLRALALEGGVQR